MSEPVKVEVVGQVAPGSVLRVGGDLDPGQADAVVEAVRQVAGHDSFVVVFGVGSVSIEQPVVNPEELSALGVIREVNRRMLHPVGMKLGWRSGEPMLFVYDDRDDPEGVRFEGVDLAEGKAAFEGLWARRAPGRTAALGYMVQPVNDPAATQAATP